MQKKIGKKISILSLQSLSFNARHFYITCVEVSQQYNGTFDLVGNSFDTCWKCNGIFAKFVGNLCNTSLNKSSWNNWVVLNRTDRCQLLLPKASWWTHVRSCPPAQPMHSDDWSNLSVGLTDVWPPLKDSCSCHLAHTPPVHFVGLLCHMLGLVPWCVLSKTPHVKTMSLTTFGLCSIVSSSTLNVLTDIPKCIFHYPPASGDPVVCYFFFPCVLSSGVLFYTPWHQGEGVVTKQDIWSSFPWWFRWWKPQGAILKLLPQLAVKNVCV